jgi:hypothetical protein
MAGEEAIDETDVVTNEEPCSRREGVSTSRNVLSTALSSPDGHAPA